MMKVKFVAPIFAAIALAMPGCAIQKINSDMFGNTFNDEMPIENDLKGIYTGAIGPLLSTYLIRQDGSGVNCYPTASSAMLLRVKIYAETNENYFLIEENGIKSTVSKLVDSPLILNMYGQKFKLKLDKNLNLANLSCKEKLENLATSI